MLSLSPGGKHSDLESNTDVLSLASPTSTEGMGSTPVKCHDQRRCEQRSPSRGASSGSASSGSRLTPPGQRTPRLSLASPPSLKHVGGGVRPLPRGCTAASEASPANSEVFSAPPGHHAGTCDSIPGCGCFSSPPGLLGLTACVTAFTDDQTCIPRPHEGAAPSAPSSGGSSSSALEQSDEDSSRDGAAHPLLGAAAGKWALHDLEQNSSRCARGARGGGGEHPENAVQACGGGHDESGAGNGDSQREPSGDGGPGKGERTGDKARESDLNRDEGNGDPGGRQGNDKGGGGGEGGGGESGDDGDGAGNNGSGARGMREEEVEEDEDGEGEADERGADEEVDTFLRLSEMDFCVGIDVLQLGGTGAAACDSSIGGPSGGGGGDEKVRVLSRHLSDFFRSPLALDPTPKRRSPLIGSLSDVQTGARLFDSVKSLGSNEDGAFSIRGSGSLSDCMNEVAVFSSSTVGGASAEVVTSVMINCIGSPPSSASPAPGAAAVIPDTIFAAGISADPEHVQTAESDELPAKTSHQGEQAATEVNDSPCEPKETEAVQAEVEHADCGHRDGSVESGGGGESEEEWLTGDVVAPAPDKWGDNSPPPSLNATPTTTQEPEPKAEETAATAGTHWAGLNDDGSWRTEVARKAAGKAGEVEAERRRLAKIIADESWRLDAGEVDGTGCRGRRDVRRESVSFIRLQTGNVRYACVFVCAARERGWIQPR